MTLPLEALAKQLNSEKTILLFGSGASIPSGAPSVSDILLDLSSKIEVSPEGYSFAEFCSLFEIQKDRREMIRIVRSRLKNLRPTGGLLNLPDNPWRSIFTTNYDDLIEKAT